MTADLPGMWEPADFEYGATDAAEDAAAKARMTALPEVLAAVTWKTQPHLLAEDCDGCGGWRERLAAYDHPSGVRSWYCEPCWGRAKRRAAA